MRIKINTEANFGTLLFAGGLGYAAGVATQHWSGWRGLYLTSGPLELAALGALLWLHAVWRRSVKG